MNLFPGKIKLLLSDAYWNDYHLTLTLSEASELIISDDVHVLQILPCSELKIKDNSLIGAVQNNSGAIAIAWHCELIVLEAIELYGKLPRWQLNYRDSLPTNSQSIFWLNEKQICFNSIDGKVLIYDISQNRIVWELSVGHAFTGSCPGYERMLSYSPGKSSNILVFYPLIGAQRKFKERPVEYSTNSHFITQAYFLTSILLVAQTEEACFVWDVSTSKLILSMPLISGIAPILLRLGERTAIIRNNNQQCCLSLIGDVPSVEQEELTEHLFQSPGLRLSASGQRFYINDDGTLKIFSLLEKEMVSRGFIGGASPSPFPELDTAGNLILAGLTLLNMDGSIMLDLNKKTDLRAVELSHLIDSERLVMLEAGSSGKRLVYYELNGKTWSQSAEGEFCALGSCCTDKEETIYLIQKDGLCKFYDFKGVLFETKSLPECSIDQASLTNGMLLLSVSNRLELWDLNLLPNGIVWSVPFKKSDSGVMALSADCRHVCAALNDNEGSSIYYWDTKKPLCRKVVTFRDGAVKAMSWSPSMNCIAILFDDKIKIFAVTSSLCGFMKEITAAKHESNKATSLAPPLARIFGGESSLRWKGDSRGVVLFNGRHIVVAEMEALISTNIENVNMASTSTENNVLVKLCRNLSEPLPIYHPSILLLCLAALQPNLVLFIFQRLTTVVRLSDTSSSEGIVYLSLFLDLEVLPPDYDETKNFDCERKTSLLELLKKYRIYGLTSEDQDRLSALVSISDSFEKLDAFGSYALASFKISGKGPSSAAAWVYAGKSITKLQLLELVQEQAHAGESLTRFPVWLDRDQLSNSMDKYARKCFAEKRDPTLVALYYLAQHNLSGLKALWRISSGHPEKDKTLKLLNQDFHEPRWRTAAHKNAYALLSKRRPEYAAAFFLLGDSVKDCCQVCVDRLDDLELAIAVARIYDASDRSGLSYLRSRYFSTSLDDKKDYCNARWTQVWLDLMLDMKAVVLENILEFSDIDPIAIFVYDWLGGTISSDVRSKLSDIFEAAGIPKVLGAHFIKSLGRPRVEQSSEGSNFAHRIDSGNLENSTRQLIKPPENLQLEPDMSVFGF